MLKLNNIMIGSSQPKVLAEFYEKVLGRPADMVEQDTWYNWKIGEMYFSFGPHSEVTGQSKEPQRIMFNFEAEDVQSEAKRIAEFATVVKEAYQMEGWDGWIATFADPDGNYFQLMSPFDPADMQ
jgi:predicted enzyme related to lactoylglutathione lyase